MRGGALLVTAFAVLLLAACGGSSGGSSTQQKQLTAAQYRAKLAKVKVEAAAAQAHVGQGLQSTTVGDLKQKVDAFAAATQRIGDEVAQVNPPSNAQAANTQLAQGLHDIAAGTRDLSGKIAKMTSAQAAISYLEHSQGPVKGSREVSQALAKLKQLGYTTGS